MGLYFPFLQLSEKKSWLCCIASKPSAVDSGTNHCQTRSPCRVQLQGRSQNSCLPCSLCPIFSWLPTGYHGKKWLFRWMCAILICILLASRNPAADQSPHLDTSLETWNKPWGAPCLFCKARARPGLAVSFLGMYEWPSWSRQLTVCVPKAQKMRFPCIREGDQCVKCGVKSDSWSLWFLTIQRVGRNSLVSTGESQLRNFLLHTKLVMAL